MKPKAPNSASSQESAPSSTSSVDDWLAELQMPNGPSDGPEAGAAQRVFAGEPPDVVLEELLAQLKHEHQADAAALRKEHEQLQQHEQALRAEYTNKIVAFLAQAQPGPLSPTARNICRQHQQLLRKLGINMDTLNSRVIKASKSSGNR